MKQIHVIATSDRRLLVISCPSELPTLLKKSETRTREWIYKPPLGLHEFLYEDPEALQGFIEAFGYWVEFRARGYIEDVKRHEPFKEKIKKFSENLLIKLRALASRIAKQVAKMWRPRHHYDEYRETKLNATQPGLGTKRFTKKEKKAIAALQKSRTEYEEKYQVPCDIIDAYFEI
ncbi:MAG: hypothetical protein WCL18_01900 [bacterium]